jgi:hypothetical protein
MAARVRTEGGGGDYGPDSGGYDQLGFGTLLFTRDRTADPAQTPSTPSPAARATSASPSASAPTPGVPPTPGGASGVTATDSADFDLSGQPSGLDATGTIVGLAGASAVAATIGGALLLRLRNRRAAEHRPPPNHRRRG